jgi:DNA (cytosine-5)-methyltransferase 1
MQKMKPKLLDLFCWAGGATRGYQLAGFYVTGVDINPQPHYIGDKFIQADALTYPLEGYDCYHASPPCQGYSIMKNLPWVKNKNHPLLIEPIIGLLESTKKPFVVENVAGAHLKAGWLCGKMFGLPFYRHRYFYSSFFWLQPGHPKHEMVILKGRMLGRRGDKGHESLNLIWMNQYEQSQAIPPAYTEFIGKYLMKVIEANK